MSVFAHKTDKGKFNLGNEADLTGIGDGTAFGAIKEVNADLSNKQDSSTNLSNIISRLSIDFSSGFIGCHEIVQGGEYDGVKISMNASDLFGVEMAIFWNLTGIWWRKKVNAATWSDWYP